MRVLQLEDDVSARPLEVRIGGKPRDETGTGAGQRAVGGGRLAVETNRQNEKTHVVELWGPNCREDRGFDKRLALQHGADACLVLPQLVELRVVLVLLLQKSVLVVQRQREMEDGGQGS